MLKDNSKLVFNFVK